MQGLPLPQAACLYIGNTCPVLPPGPDLKGKALPSGLASTLMAEVAEDLTEGSSRSQHRQSSNLRNRPL